MDPQLLIRALVASVVFSVIGLAVFGVGFWLVRKLMPFDVYKEIEADQNVALGLVLAAIILGQALIIAAAIHGG